MNLTQVGGLCLILIVVPILGALPLIQGIFGVCTGRNLKQLGTGNISVSAAFYHGGTIIGILAVLSEASKGILAVLLARFFFQGDPTWELLSLMALVIGRYWGGKGAGVTNVFWGMMVHDWQATLLSALIGLVSFTLFRERRSGQFAILFILVLVLTLRHPYNQTYIGMAFLLMALLAWILRRMPDDLTLPDTGVSSDAKQMFQFFRGDKALISLNQKLKANKVGQKAANLSKIKRLGYAVPDGWVLLPGDDPQAVIDCLDVSIHNPFVVRSSAMGEDGENASSAGQYLSILNITTKETLKNAIFDCLGSYNRVNARQYRQDFQQIEQEMAILIQRQVQGVFSGVAFSRDPVNPWHKGVIIEALPGDATQIVSGHFTPERYEVELEKENKITPLNDQTGDIPASILEKVAQIARELEKHYQGIPQDIEWSYDGTELWLLQTRPITTNTPIWTRKIASEVIPGVIRPLTWSINRPVTCGVWGDLFTLVLGKRAQGLNFAETATLHYQRAYFNATLLGEIFLKMGLPPESLEFLIRGAKFTKPPLIATLRNMPGLWRLLQREWSLERDFQRDNQRYFQPLLTHLAHSTSENRTVKQIHHRIKSILSILPKITYYSILSPLSFALRQSLFRIPFEQLDPSQSPEIASIRALAALADQERKLLPMDQLEVSDCASLFAYLAENPDGKTILDQFQDWLQDYGYLGEVGTDIAVPRWRDNPHPVRELFSQFLLNPELATKAQIKTVTPSKKPPKALQNRLHLKGKVTAVYACFLAQLRWQFLDLARLWCQQGLLETEDEIFFLEFPDIEALISEDNPDLRNTLAQRLQDRQNQYSHYLSLEHIPFVLYGNRPPSIPLIPNEENTDYLEGIGASSGIVEGTVQICFDLSDINQVDSNVIVVVPSTDAGWTPLLAKAGGIIAEVGGMLSHGAIIAREYAIPAVMDVPHATQRLKNGQRIRMDGQQGLIFLLK